jgi:hypothetical protein
MGTDKGAMSDATNGLRAIFDRLAEFFHLFDLSFFVSGSATFAAVALLYIRMEQPRQFPFASWVGGVALIVVCYILGLMSFSIGRSLNRFRRGRIETGMAIALQRHQFDGKALAGYVDSNGGRDFRRIYIRLWAELTQRHPKSLALAHLSRYWVMSAMYDGLAISFITWGLVAVLSCCHSVVRMPLSPVLAAVLAATFIGLAIVAARQAAKYLDYQVEDLVAMLSATRSPIV